MLTANQEKFVQGIIEGMSQSEAYRAAYPKQRSSDKTIWECASKLLKNPKVSTRLKELRDKLASPSIMTAQERLEFLTGVINGTNGEKVIEVIDGEKVEIEVPASMKNRLSAIDIMNKMQGEYVQKVEANVSYEDNLRKLIGDDEY